MGTTVIYSSHSEHIPAYNGEPFTVKQLIQPIIRSAIADVLWIGPVYIFYTSIYYHAFYNSHTSSMRKPWPYDQIMQELVFYIYSWYIKALTMQNSTGYNYLYEKRFSVSNLKATESRKLKKKCYRMLFTANTRYCFDKTK